MGKKQTFTIVIERDPESGWLVGEVVELPGCYSQAADMPALESNLREATAAHLAASEGDEPRPDFIGTWRLEIVA